MSADTLPESTAAPVAVTWAQAGSLAVAAKPAAAIAPKERLLIPRMILFPCLFTFLVVNNRCPSRARL